MTKLPSFALLLLLCTSCTQFPALEGTVAPEVQTAEYPALVPFDQLDLTALAASDEAEGLAARSAALKTRANRLRGSVIDESSRTRLQSGTPPR